MKHYKVWSFYTETAFIWARSASEAIAGTRGIPAGTVSARRIEGA